MTDAATATATTGPAIRSGRDRLTLHLVAAVVTLLVLAPLVAPGYVLSYDMVFVPHQPLRWDLIAPTSGLPRAVPQDAVVSLLNLAVPGWLLQRVALAGAIYAAAIGAGRLVPAERSLTRVVAAVCYAWTPFLAGRLLLGQWGLLLAYAALPWLVAAAMGVRAGRPGALPRVILAAAVSAITPTGGVIALAATAVLTFGVDRPTLRRSGVSVAAVALLNAPWLVAAAVTTAGGRSDPAGVAAFAARGENWSGPVGALAGTGGIWNAQTTPASRASVLVPVVTVALLCLAGAGVGVLWRRWPAGGAARLAILAGAGIAVAVFGTLPLTADALAWAVSRIPGAGLLRDGQKFVMPYALLLATGAALGAERLAARFKEPRARLVLMAMVALPVALTPDLAFGGAGALRPVSYPADWDRVAARVADAPGEVLALPFSEYRNYSWNRGRTVFDPAPRYLPAEVLADDTLRIGDLLLEGENPRAARVRDLLAAGSSVAQTAVAWVVVQHEAGGSIPRGSLDGLRLVYSGRFLELYANPAAGPYQAPHDARRWVLVAIDSIALASVMAAIWRLRRAPTVW